ncbi:stage IV sporulation protein A, partial [Bacillus subtilis]|uniref:stage IV sporulation protein A n=1 Tax=Bacillus subtilis TaxID=1423 RepID=UPI00295F210A
WYEEPIPFQEAAEIGTRKVIQEHSTLGVVITTDGTIGDIPRQDYLESEGRVVEELKEVGKPFIMIVNSVRPSHPETEELRKSLAEEYDIPVLAMSIESMTDHDINSVLREVLFEFPVHEVNVNLPSWVMVLNNEHWLRQSYEESVRETVKDIKRLRDVDRVVSQFT